jgi:hypothetical protein
MFENAPSPSSTSSASSRCSKKSQGTLHNGTNANVESRSVGQTLTSTKKKCEIKSKSPRIYKLNLVRNIKQKLLTHLTRKKIKKKGRKRQLSDSNDDDDDKSLLLTRKKCKYNAIGNNCNTSNTNYYNGTNSPKYSTVEAKNSDFFDQTQACFLMFKDDSTIATASASPTTTATTVDDHQHNTTPNGFLNDTYLNYFYTPPLSIYGQYTYQTYEHALSEPANSRIKQDLLKLSYDKFKLFRLNEKLLKQTVLTRNAIKLLQVEIQQQQQQQQQQRHHNGFILNQVQYDNIHQQPHQINYNQQVVHANNHDQLGEQNENLLILKSSIKYNQLINDACDVYAHTDNGVDDREDLENDNNNEVDPTVDLLKRNIQNPLIDSLHPTTDLMQLYQNHGLDANNNNMSGINGTSTMANATYFFVNDASNVHSSTSSSSLISHGSTDANVSNPSGNVTNAVQTTTTHCVLVHAR